MYLEVLLASPLMTLFSNLLCYSEATHILSMFMLDGEKFIMDLVFRIYQRKEKEILQIKDQFEIQAYLSK